MRRPRKTWNCRSSRKHQTVALVEAQNRQILQVAPGRCSLPGVGIAIDPCNLLLMLVVALIQVDDHPSCQ